MAGETGTSKNLFLESIKREELAFCDEADSFLQSGFWGAFKARFDWEALAFKIVWKTDSATPGATQSLLVLSRSLAAGFSLAYIPWGPQTPSVFPSEFSVGANRNAALKELALSLKGELPSSTAFIRFDPPWFMENDSLSFRITSPFIRAGADIQPPDTVLLDLTQGMESLLDGMKPKWRYNARLAVKKGVTIRLVAANEIDVFYDLLKETAKRDGIAIHGKEYYSTLMENNWYNGVKPDIRIYLAEHEGEALAGIVTLFMGRNAVYLYGASSGNKRNLMAPYALQVKAMEDAIVFGCEVYDLFGIPPSEDPSHPMAGLYRFKTGFGGTIVHRPGCWDYPCRPIICGLFRWAEALRKNLRTIKKKRFRSGTSEKENK